jgi:hypothetical protein
MTIRDYGHNDSRQYKIDAFDFSGKSKGEVIDTGKYGDNAMVDPTKMNEDIGDDDNSSHVNIIHSMLNKAGFDDARIASGITLRPTALQKVAAKLGVSARDIKMLISTLVSHLRKDGADMVQSVYEDLVSEPDADGNLTIRDTDTGKSSFVTGDAAAQIRRRMDRGNENEQDILADYNPNKTTMREWIDSMVIPGHKIVEQPKFVGSIDAGIPFNFPWKIGHEHGTATAYATGYGTDMGFRVISVRDEDGDEFEASAELLDQLREIAKESINDV